MLAEQRELVDEVGQQRADLVRRGGYREGMAMEATFGRC